tara:strand:+ start:2986 stop:3333 length:348 start_codon:yes stop_codon:yes gene_type:complete
MKSSQLKMLVKEAVKEAIQEELKEILLEAIKTPKVTTIASPQIQSVIEQQTPQQPIMSSEEKRAAYSNILGDTAASFTSANVPQSFSPQGGYDSSNGTLPAGEVDMGMIAGLMKK